MSPHLLPVFVLLPAIVAIAMLVLHSSMPAKRVVAVLGVVANLLAAVWAFVTVYQGRYAGQVLVTQMGNWPAPYGITVAMDTLSAVMVAVTAVVALGTLIHGLGTLTARFERGFYYPLFFLLIMGVNWAFITGDLFNLFVSFEIMLMASYALMVAGTTARQMRQAYVYVILNLVGSTLFVAACGFIYGQLGTLNLAEIASLSLNGDLPPDVLPAAMVLLLVFASKAAAFPLWFWLPGTYASMPPSIGGLFGALLTKVGVYALIRVFVMCFQSTPLIHDTIGPVLLFSAACTMVIAALGAAGMPDVRRILSLNIISGVGVMLLGIGLFTEIAVAGAIFYMAQHMIVKCALFLCCGSIERRAGTSRLAQLGGLMERSGWLATMFFLAAISLVGLPPFSGFFGKFLILGESLTSLSWWSYVLCAAVLLMSLLTLLSMLKIWGPAFWSEPSEAVQQHEDTRTPAQRWLAGAGVTLMVAAAIAIAAAAPWCIHVAETASRGVVQPQAYVAAVLGPSHAEPANAQLDHADDLNPGGVR